MKKKILMIGPDIVNAGGGMAQVISTINASADLHRRFDLSAYASFREGSVWQRFLFEKKEVLHFRQAHLTEKYDLFHIHMASRRSAYRKCCYAEMIRKAGRPYIVQIHSGAFPTFYRGQNNEQKERIRGCVENAELVIALSENWKKIFTSMFQMKRCVVVPNGIDIAHFSGGISEVTEDTRSRFLFLGRLEEDKGVFDLLEAVRLAAEENPAICVDLAGRGDEEKVRKTIHALHIEDHVRLAGWADDARKMQLLRACGTVILPSHFEAMPVSVLEGMAAGKAIVATDVGAIPDMIASDEDTQLSSGEGTKSDGRRLAQPEHRKMSCAEISPCPGDGKLSRGGILVHAGDMQALAGAMTEVSMHPDKLAAMQNFNRKRAEDRYSLEVMYEALGRCYDSV